jgi:hypothetical protein
MRRPDRSVYLEIFVRSEIRPWLLKKGIVEHGAVTQMKERQGIGTLAGAMAEELCEQYADSLEPSAVARAAMDCYDELVAENPVLKLGDELPRDADPKYTRMAKH